MSVTATTYGELLPIEEGHHIVLMYMYMCRDACSKIWGEELKELVEDRGKRGGEVHVMSSCSIL